MIIIAARIAIAGLVAGWLMAADVHAQDTLASARDLYASAQYDEALKVLDALPVEATTNDVRLSVDLYRTLCLLAVGRSAEADRAIEQIVMREPLFRPSDDLPPRTRLAFSEARRRVLPAIVQQQYAEANLRSQGVRVRRGGVQTRDRLDQRSRSRGDVTAVAAFRLVDARGRVPRPCRQGHPAAATAAATGARAARECSATNLRR
jgi:hypothetical protein